MSSPRASSEPIRLGYLVSQYPAVNHTHILREIRGLRELGFVVHVASIRPPDRPPEQLTEVEREEAASTFVVLSAGLGAILAAHVETLVRHPIRYLSALAYAIGLGGANIRAAASKVLYFGEAVIAGRHFARLGVGHVHSHFSSTVLLILARIFPIQPSATIHGSAEFEDMVGFHLREKVAQTHFVRAISDYGASQLMRASDPKHWGKIEVVRLGVDTSVFSGHAAGGDGTTELLYVGSLAPPKGQVILIEAVERVIRNGNTHIHLRLVGDGPMRSYLERMIAERGLSSYVTLEGACNQDRVLEFYRQADLFVLPSFAEGVPVVLMEAMAMGVPCLATWITGVPELIRHGVDGWLVPPGNAVKLADAIQMLISDKGLRARLGAAGRMRVQEEYELARTFARMGELYRKRLTS